MEYRKDGELHGRKGYINEDGRMTQTERPKLAPRASILPA